MGKKTFDENCEKKPVMSIFSFPLNVSWAMKEELYYFEPLWNCHLQMFSYLGKAKKF